ncbi:MAG: DNA double-strand break repair nuclease NurA [Candidatus Heimdallarchaeota archaeon]|nr:DNA double-strand break repair nuclease NurA [Candidatus Heimdallarchaeota archaeon]
MDEFISKGFESNITSKIMIAQQKLKKLVEEVKSIDLPLFDLPEVIKPKKIAAIDGGGFSEDLVGVTVVPSRAAGAIFEQYKDPIWIEKEDLEILTIEEDPKNFGALLRDLLEVEVACELVNYNPEAIFLDGSITNFAYKGIPLSIHHTLREGKEIDDSIPGYRFYQLFLKFIKTAYKLITECLKKDILLIGISKDSRTDILVKHLFAGRKNKPAISDTTFVKIKAGSKRCFTKPIEFIPELREERKMIWAAAQVFTEAELRKFYLSYFILKEGALPIRVDSLLPQKHRLNEIQELLVTYHDGNGFITPAYLTHSHAHMTNDYGERIINILAEKVLDESPEIYQAFLAKRRRDIIQ